MRRIHLTDDVTLRFPQRSEDFDEGVELGILAAAMGFGTIDHAWIGRGSREQARALAEKMGYRVVEGQSAGDWIEITFRPQSTRPKLTLVHSARAPAP
jgi:hypothetical protein